MEEDQPTSVKVKDAVHRLQLSLLDGIQNEDQLFAAGSLMSRGDYQDVVVERTIAKLCGYPLCNNALPSEQARKGRYRISLKEHKVYDQHETHMYCSSSCLVNSRAFAGSLQEERSMAQNPGKIAEILRLFDKLSLDSEGMGKNGDLGMSKLTIQEKGENQVGEVSLGDWIGPSNAIEGYVPQRDRKSKTSSLAKGHRADEVKSSSEKYSFVNDLDFTSTIIISSDEYSVSKSPSSLPTSIAAVQDIEGKGSSGKVKAQSSGSARLNPGKMARNSNTGKSKVVKIGGLSNQDMPSSSNPQSTCSLNKSAGGKETSEVGMTSEFCQSMLKPSLKSPGSKKLGRSVTWADEEVGSSKTDGLGEDREMEGNFASTFISSDDTYKGDDESNVLLESAEACALALSQAAEAAASGEVDIADAISDAGLIIIPQIDNMDQKNLMEYDNVEGQEESANTKWPSKPGIPRTDMFDPEYSWYDGPPEGFSLELSPFATMWMALFGWVTSSSLAYIYGKDESSHEDFLSVNGRDYPHKIVLADGRSSEIKRTVEGCLARALPAVVADLRLSIPLSILEQGVGRLVNTMGFVDAIPALRMKQWQVMAILFLEALSICRIPALTSNMSNKRGVVHQVLEGARIGTEEYAMMKDFMMPLGRLPDFASQSGA